MKIILKLLKFYREDELESRWWHRLVKVLIYGSTIIVFAISIGLFIDDIGVWNNPDPKYIYSFEPKYSDTFGFSKSCTFATENSKDSLFIDCGNINQKWKGGGYGFLPDFLDRYSRAGSYKEEFLVRTKPEGCDTRNDIESYFCKLRILNVNYQLLNQRIEQGQFDNIQAKRIIILSPLIKNILLTLTIPIIWFLLLKSVIYRAFVYVILGKKK